MVTIWSGMANPATGHKNGSATVAKNISAWTTATRHGKQEQKRK
jgi:hypothetical protein